MASLAGILQIVRNERALTAAQLDKLDRAIEVLGGLLGRNRSRVRASTKKHVLDGHFHTLHETGLPKAQRERWARVKAKKQKKAA